MTCAAYATDVDTEDLKSLAEQVKAGGAKKYHEANARRGKLFARERIDRLGLAEGQAVRLLPSHLSLFESRQAATTAGAAR